MMKKRWGMALLAAVCLCGMVLPLPASAEGTAKEKVGTMVAQTIAKLAEKWNVGAKQQFPMESLCYSSNGTVVRAQSVEDETYLFLPASADNTCLVLNCDLKEGQLLYVAGDKLPEGVPAADSFALDAVATPEQGKYTLKLTVRSRTEDGTIASLSKEETLVIMQSANFSAVYLTSAEENHGRKYVESSKK